MTDSVTLASAASGTASLTRAAEGRSPAASASSTPPHVVSPPSAALTSTLARLLAAASDTAAQATAQAFSSVHVPLPTPTNPTSVVSREAAAVRLVSALCGELAEFHRRVDRLLQEHAAATGSAPIVISPPEVLAPALLHASSASSSDGSPATSALSSPAFDVAAWSRQAAATAASAAQAATDSTVPASASAVLRPLPSSQGPQPPAVAALLAASVASPEPINVVLTQMQPESSPPLSLMVHAPLPNRFTSLSPLPPAAAAAATVNAQRSGAAAASASPIEAARESSTIAAPPALASAAVPMDEVSLAALVQFDLATRASLRVSHPRLSFAAASARILEAFRSLSSEEKQRYADKQKTMQQEQRQAEEKKQQAAVQARPKRKAVQQPPPSTPAATSAAVVASAVHSSTDAVPAVPASLFAPSPMLSYHPRRGSTDGSFYALNHAPSSFGSSLTSSPIIPPSSFMQAQMAQPVLVQSPAPAQAAHAMMAATPFTGIPAHRFPQAVPSRMGSVEFTNAVAAYPGRRGSIAASAQPGSRAQFSLPPAVPLAFPFPGYQPSSLHLTAHSQLPPQNMLLASPMLSSGALARLRSTSHLAFGHTPQHNGHPRSLHVQTHSGSSQQLQASDFPVIGNDKAPSSSPALSPRSAGGASGSLAAGVPSPSASPRGNQASELMQLHPHNSLRRDSTFSFAPGSPPAASLSSISAANNAGSLQSHHIHQLSSNSINSSYYQPASMSRNVSGVNLNQRDDSLMVGVGDDPSADHLRAMMNGSPVPAPNDSPRHLDRDDLHSRSNSLLFSRRRSTSMASPPPHDRDDPRGSTHEAIRIQPFVEEGEEEQQEDDEREDRRQATLKLQEGQTDNEDDAPADRNPTDDELDQAGAAAQPPPMLLPSPIKRKLHVHAPPSAALIHALEQTPAKKQRHASSNRS